MLRASNLAIMEGLVCAAGVADLATVARDVIFEVKHRLTRAALYQAVGQVLIYRACINPQARAVIVGYPTMETAALQPHIAALGIEVICWVDRDWGLGLGEEGTHHPNGDQGLAPGDEATYKTDERKGLELSEGGTHAPRPTGQALPPSPQPLSPMPQALYWRVAELARAQGIPNVARLAFQLGMDRQALYPIWNDTAKSATLTTIGRLCQFFAVAPGDWFVWGHRGWGLGSGDQPPTPNPQAPSPKPQTLRWNIAAEAQRRGILDVARLGYAAQLYHKTALAIWRSEMSVAYLETLARLTRVLDLPEAPFSTGGMLTWDAPGRG
jgi:DNA-binding Xre family transcriptional regulator